MNGRMGLVIRLSLFRPNEPVVVKECISIRTPVRVISLFLYELFHVDVTIEKICFRSWVRYFTFLI